MAQRLVSPLVTSDLYICVCLRLASSTSLLCARSRGGFRWHIRLSCVCYYLRENPSRCLIQPSNHLLRVISRAFLNCKQNDMPYSAHCFSWGLTRRHSSNPVWTQASVCRQLGIWMREQHEKYMWVMCYSLRFTLLIARGCCEYGGPLQTPSSPPTDLVYLLRLL